MRRIILSTVFILLAGVTMAQETIRLTFDRTGTDANSVTVNVIDANGTAINGVSATVNTSHTFKSTSNKVTNAIICPNINANTTPTIELTFTITGIPGDFTFNKVGLDIHALNGSSNYQESNDNVVRQWNVAAAVNDVNFGTLENIDIAAGIAEHHKVWDIDGNIVSVNGTVTAKLTITTGTTNPGCFFGLSEIIFQNVYVKPEKFYSIRLTPTYNGDPATRAGAIMSVNKDAGLYCLENYSGSSNEIFTFENSNGNMYMKSVHTNTYISTLGGSQEQVMIAAEDITNAKSITISKLGTTTVNEKNVYLIGITPDGGAMLNCSAKPGNVVAYNNTSSTKASAWYLTEVADFKHTLTVTTDEWATLVLGFNATIPTAEGFKAYTISSVEDDYVKLEEVTGVLQANVPVLVNAPEGDYEFAYTTEAATVTESGLHGTLYDKDITVADAYVLGIIDGKVGFGKATTTGKAEGTFTNNANKAYFVATTTEGAANVASYSFRFVFGTTGVEEVETESGNVKVIYDLTGRRVEVVTAPGIYIINGKKVLVK